MRRPTGLAPCLLLALLAGCSGGEPASRMTGERPLAHGVFVASPGTPEDDVPDAQLQAYLQASGADGLAFVYVTNNWFRSRAFPADVVRRVVAGGSVPFVRLMLRSSDDEATGPDDGYTLQDVTDGTLDADLRAWARGAAAAGVPVYAEYGTEVNGRWFAWNGLWNGQEAGPERFVQAYRHVANVVRQAGADNVRWVFHVAAQDDPDTDWNRLERYYPGGDVVSVLGVSAYGAQSPTDAPVQGLREQLDDVMPRLQTLAPTKPVLLLEFGSSAGASPAPEVWADAALRDLTARRWPALRGFAWWDSAWANDDDPAHDSELRVERLPALAAVFRRYMQGGMVTRTLDLSP
ncbi:glycoside hydrolase family 26 protein [Deinococcus aquiradiocola]|uniref:GH26 domain-containing protein n=1 Tax=Deinococcus aquiradiocola TaxID=393059 RepID=A0A917P839_9DEIO|nr:glycosyl hydrolase [Deinococcus aquiradiocola]GGJ66124.1 hypothetical protein GCM10008939_07690 [Deinococcus aquiradiocola]